MSRLAPHALYAADEDVVQHIRGPVVDVVVSDLDRLLRLARLLKQVGDLLGDRALVLPVNPGEQDTLSPALVHLARLGQGR
jgi:hypothetical protein